MAVAEAMKSAADAMKPVGATKKVKPVIPKKVSVKNNGASPKEKPPTSAEVKKMSIIERKLYQDLNIMSCKEIREHLDATTQLSEAEKIEFITLNINSSKSLRTWVKNQHFGLKELKAFTTAGKGILNAIRNKTFEVCGVMFDSADMNDADCVFLRTKVKKYNEERAAIAQEEAQSHEWRIRGYARNAWAGVTNAASKGYNAAKYVGNTLNDYVVQPINTYAIQPLWSALKKGFELWTWISRDPKVAYCTLVTLKAFRNGVCKYVGKSLGDMGNIQDNSRDELIEKIKGYKSDYVIEDSMGVTGLRNILQELSAIHIASFKIKGASAIFDLCFDKGFASLQAMLTTGLTLIGGPFGTALALSLNLVLGTILTETKEAVKLAEMTALHTTHTGMAFEKLLEVIDPRTCIAAMVEEAQSVMISAQDVSYKAALPEDFKRLSKETNLGSKLSLKSKKNKLDAKFNIYSENKEALKRLNDAVETASAGVDKLAAKNAFNDYIGNIKLTRADYDILDRYYKGIQIPEPVDLKDQGAKPVDLKDQGAKLSPRIGEVRWKNILSDTYWSKDVDKDQRVLELKKTFKKYEAAEAAALALSAAKMAARTEYQGLGKNPLVSQTKPIFDKLENLARALKVATEAAKNGIEYDTLKNYFHDLKPLADIKDYNMTYIKLYVQGF